MATFPEVIETTLIRILSPLIRIMLRNGVAHGAFSDIVRKIYVDCGFEEIERRGKKQTISNVSILTGLNRKEVKRLHESIALDTDSSLKKFNRIVRVIAGWQHDPEFLDEDQEPRDLKLDEDTASFSDLVRRYSGDMPVVAMLNALIDSGNIKIIDNGTIQLINPNYLVSSDSDQKLNILGIDTAELIDTIDHNIRVEHPEDARFQRKASNTHIARENLPRVRKIINKKAQQLLEDIDRDFTSAETDKEEESVSVSIGIYYWQKSDDDFTGKE